jgi:glucose-1-phosphate cytidylyltransferase
MKVLILAGGFGTRLSEETDIRPKPMAEIGGKPVLWHIMKIYSAYGFNEFVVLLGYKGYYIKEYFANYFLHQSDVTIDISNNKMEVHNNQSEPWKVTLLDTGLHTMTGGRILRARDFVGNQSFMLTYGDGVADINLNQLVDFHKQHGRAITMTSVQPEGRFGGVVADAQDKVTSFMEKPKGDGSWINGGFFVCEPRVFDYLENDTTVFEQKPLEKLSADNELYTYRHQGFWKCMDTLRDKTLLNELWDKQQAKWKIWE